MYTRLTKEGRALRNGVLKFLGRAGLVIVAGGTFVFAARAAVPAVTSWWRDVRLSFVTPPAMAVAQEPQVKTDPQPQPVQQQPRPQPAAVRSEHRAVVEWNDRGIEWHTPQYSHRTVVPRSTRGYSRERVEPDREAQMKQREKEWREKRERETQRQAHVREQEKTKRPEGFDRQRDKQLKKPAPQKQEKAAKQVPAKQHQK